MTTIVNIFLHIVHNLSPHISQKNLLSQSKNKIQHERNFKNQLMEFFLQTYF
jgi:hypothetical protein